MARTIQQIYTNFITEKNTYSNLSTMVPTNDDLASLLQDIGSTPSTVAVWRLWVYLFRYGVWTLETLWDTFLANVNALIAAQEVPTLLWYQTRAFAFQYGDALIQQAGKFIYNPIVAAHQIVARCAAIETPGVVTIKTAKLIGGVLTPLITAEIAALQSYFGRIKPAGINVVCVSFSPDIVNCPVTIYYDPLIMDNTGQLIATPGTYPVIDAINGYLAFISGVANQAQFNGALNLTQLNDAIQAAIGVKDLILGDVQATYGSLPYATIVREYLTNAGYCIIDPAHPLIATITYLPYTG